jgi:hypothetical protein
VHVGSANANRTDTHQNLSLAWFGDAAGLETQIARAMQHGGWFDRDHG